MTGILALVGSGEFTKSQDEVDTFLLSQLGDPHVAILPTAAGLEHDVHKWIDDGVAHFDKLGVKAEGIELYNHEDANDPSVIKKLHNYNFFYFSGGDPGHLLHSLQGSKAWEVIVKSHKNGAILAGSSAGAMVLGKKVWADVYRFDKKKELLPWVPGLDLVPFGVMPHYDAIPKYFSKKDLDSMYANMPEDIEIIGIDEDTAYINTEGLWKVMGEGNMHKDIRKSLL